MWNIPIEMYIKKNKNKLDIKIGEYLIKLDEKIFNTNLSKVAKELKVVPSTITKFLHKCGYEGWKVYTIFAYISLNRNSSNSKVGKKTDLAKEKIVCFEFIETVFESILIKIAKKMKDSKKIILAAHQSTKEYLRILERNLKIIGKNVEVVDISDKYYEYENHINTMIFVFSFSGINSNLKFLETKLSKLKLPTKIFISPSKHSYECFNYNITTNQKKYLFSNIEKALPIVKISFIQHCLDIIISEIISKNQHSLRERFKKLGIQDRIES